MIRNAVLSLLLSFSFAATSLAQVFPAEGSKLHYRLIGFSFPAVVGSSNYKIEIAAGYFNDEHNFSGNIIKTFTASGGRLTAEVPAFGANYTWRVRGAGNVVESKPAFHHFSTLPEPEAANENTRLRVTHSAGQYADAYVLIDGTKSLYDMSGKRLWFLPQIDGFTDNSVLFGDMKITPQGTITFLSDRRNGSIFEISYNGNKLWQGPNTGQVSGDTTEHYNHEFTRLPNGHYMVLGTEQKLWQLPGKVDTGITNDPDNAGKIIKKGAFFFQKITFMTLIEYDKSGKVLWSLHTSRFFKQGTDAYSTVNAKGVYSMDEMLVNSFFFDQQDSAIYIGFRNVGRVLKVHYPDGAITAVYGNWYLHGVRTDANNLFCWQHSAIHSPKGYVYMFNNNVCGAGEPPKITVMQDPATKDDTSKKIWEYTCVIDGVEGARPYSFGHGGNVSELPDSSFFVSMSHEEYTKIFIVDRNKRVLWSAIPEQWNEAEHKWKPIFQYKASIVTGKSDIERLIWSAGE